MSLTLDHIYYTYSPGTAFERHALEDISFEIPDGQFLGIIGHTGSGKSTLIQHFNGLMQPTKGRVLCNGEDIWGKKYNRRELRFHVGLVFQYPEYQLFETTVLKDVCYGPKNQGLPEEEQQQRAKAALLQVGIREEEFEKSPFDLSGGKKRRVAIAGILAMNPDVLILDEPTAGLDPMGRDEILDQIRKLQQERGITVILVSHSMEDVARYVDRVLVIHEGRLAMDGTPREVFRQHHTLENMGLSAPQVTYLMERLKEKGLPVDEEAITVEEAKQSILAALQK